MLGLAVKEGLPLVTVMVWDESCLRPPSSEASRTAALSSKYPPLPGAEEPLLWIWVIHSLREGAVSDFSPSCPASPSKAPHPSQVGIG